MSSGMMISMQYVWKARHLALTINCARAQSVRTVPINARLRRPDNLLKVCRSTFQYSPLRQNDQTTSQPKIRLLKLLPGSDSERIRCVLKETHLDGSEVYETVSYYWGDRNARSGLICNGSMLSIPVNLEEALHDLRYKDRPRVLWADAVCINQSDPAEKASQVPLMRSIYSQARRTIIWLGRKNDRYDQSASPFTEILMKSGLVLLGSLVDPVEYPRIAALDTRTGGNTELLPFSGQFYLSLMSILRRPWFRRAWVVQEVAVSCKATILWDRVEYDWENVVEALKQMSTAKFPLAFIDFQHIAAIDNERRRYRSRESTLLGVLLRHQRTMATDPGDKVYAFLGLVDKFHASQAVRVSYTDSITSVYREVAIKILQHDRSLDIMSRSPSPVYSKLNGLPSWVPDWSISTSPNMGYTWSYGPLSLAGADSRHRHDQEPRFAAAGKTKYRLADSLTPDKLSIEGFVFDTITESGPVFEGVRLPNSPKTIYGISRGWMNTVRTFLKARMVIIHWQQMTNISSNSYYVNGEPMCEAFWQTVCAGEYYTSSAVNKAARLWEKAARYSAFRLTHIPALLDFLGLLYSFSLLARNMLTNKLQLEFELQGRYTLHRRMIKTSRGYIGLASCAAKVGDSIAICKGSSVPLIFRRASKVGAWMFVGDTYVHGGMHGELYDEKTLGKMLIV